MIFHITNGFNPLNTNTVGGVIFADIIENRKQVQQALALGTPLMIINNRVDDLPVNFIAVDNMKGGWLAADYLINLGHSRVATITGNLNTQGGKERFDGFVSCLRERGVVLPETYVVEGDYSRRSARAAVEHFLSLEEKPTAIFAASDEMALEAMATLLEKGFKIPTDVSVIGFDDNPACLYGPVGLTTIKQPLFQMAEEAVKVLNRLIHEKFDRLYQEVLVPSLIVRESCAPPRYE
jgi:DNA-binding LacI/PurR family transcriptional regulator